MKNFRSTCMYFNEIMFNSTFSQSPSFFCKTETLKMISRPVVIVFFHAIVVISLCCFFSLDVPDGNKFTVQNTGNH